ncbi:MAG: histidine phosphatase family protein [Bacteroidota bacterium]|nr:histidine phosphatase family protein [Bacteroidota bacterium]
MSFNRIYTSPLRMCIKLALKVAKADTVIIHDPRLKELNFGKWEGKALSELKDDTRLFRETYKVGKQCPRGESYQDLIDRTKSFLSDLKCENGTIGVVACGGVIRAFMSLIENRPPMEMFGANVEFGQIFHYELKN